MKKIAALLLAIAAGVAAAHSISSSLPQRVDAATPTVGDALREAGIGPPRRSTLLAQANMACGLQPLPPMGCKIGACVCDQHGRNCQWTFICG